MTHFVVLRRTGPQWNPTLRLEKQVEWPAHAAFMDGLVRDGFVVLGGPLADEERVVLVIEADGGARPYDARSRAPRCVPELRWRVSAQADPSGAGMADRDGSPQRSAEQTRAPHPYTGGIADFVGTLCNVPPQGR